MKVVLKIDGYSNYEIYPREGRIWSCLRNKFLKIKTTKNGYSEVSLISDDGKKKSCLVHRVIYTACYGPIPEGLQVNHIDEDKSNNSIFNLNLMTPKENNNWGSCRQRMVEKIKGRKYSDEHKLKLSKAKIGNHNRKPKKVGAFKGEELIMIFSSIKEAELNGYSRSAVCKCCKNCFNKEGNNIYKGYQWKYIEKEVA